MVSCLKDNFTKMRPGGTAIWLLIACLVAMAAQSGETAGTRVVCYYTNWSVYRPGTAKFNPQNINPYLCTHLIYAFGGFTKENTLKPFDKYQDIEKGGYAKFTGLKTYNQNLKTMIAIGGWNEGSSRFSSLVASAERRRELVKNSIKFMRQNKFDGLDLDWEYPAFRDGGKPKDRGNYAKLVQELRQEFEKESEATGRPRLLLTMAVPAGIEYIDKGYDVPKLNRYLDWMNILSYDYHSAFEPAVDHHSPLYALEAASEYNYDSELNIDYTIKHYLEAGADKDKLVLGIPTYGRSFTLFNPESTDIGAPADGPGEQGEATREKGYLAYYEICESLMPKTRTKRQADDEDEEEYEDEEEAEEWTVVQPNPKAMGPYAYKGNQWVGYDDIDIVKKKAEYVAEQGLGGIMFWSIDNDDFRGKCHGKPYPLIEAAKGALYKSLGLTEKIPPKKTQSTRKRTRPSKPSKPSDEDKDVSKNTIRNNRKKTRVTEAEPEDEPTTKSASRLRLERRRSSTRAPATAAATPDWGLNTPEPPTTPDPGTDFKCEEEGFFPHPRDCKKYFWCLESGPSNLGIIAHQFNCPSGLYFNKAADSCDFSRNVVCNPKKAETTAAPRTTTSTTTTTTTETPDTTTSSRPPSSLAALFTTRRPLPRITAATSKTTLLVRGTTTPVPVEEEYEDDEEKIVGLPELESEEDPKVIKELVDLIKKLGGIEQLEKHLANTGKVSQGTKTTTPATISRLLFERVLSQARPNGERAPPQFNSRGPQAAGLAGTVVDTETNSNPRSRRPQYTTINRNRPSTTTEEAAEDEEDISAEEDEENEYKRPSSTTTRSGLPQYVNIRRARPSTTEEPQPTIRNALYERDSLESTSDEDDVKNGVQGFEYSTIRRFRPESQESQETTTSKYKVIQRVRPTTVASSSEEKDDLEKTTLSIREISTEIPSTSSPSTQASVLTSPKYATVSRFPTTTPSDTVETTIYNQNDITEANDINVEIASPSFASENGFIKNVDSSSVLNAQITTLSNIPKSKDERTNSLSSNPISYSTEVTISEEPFSSTQRITLFAKRTRPTTTSTANPPDISETSTSANKVSFDRKYASVKRTRLSASSNTSSPLLRARFNNDILSDTGNDTLDEDISSDSILAERNETLLQDRFRPRIRKIRSTTPASDENKNDDANTDSEEANYGSKKFVRPQSRFSARRFQSVSSSQVEKVDESETPKGENGLPSIRKFIPKGTPLNGQSSFRTRKLQTSSTQAADDGDSASNGSEIDSQSEVIESSSRRPQPRRQFRPSLSSFESADLSSLTALDNTRRREENADTSTGFRNSQVSRRFRPSFTSNTREPVEDSQNSDSSITPVISERQRSYVARGGRFTTFRTTVLDSEEDSEIPESSVVPRARKLGIARFSPRPFTRVTEGDDGDEEADSSEDNELNAEISYDSKPIGKARLTAPVINVIEENKTRGSSFSTPSGSINVTKIINSNILLGQTNNKSGILLLRRPSLLSPGSFKSSDDVRNVTKVVDEKLERINLSESNIEEKELIRETALLLERPRKRIIVKKLRSTTALSDTPATEESLLEFNKAINLESISEPIGRENGKNETGRPRIRKILRRRPATSTTAEEQTTTERIKNELIDTENFDLNKTNLVQDAPLPRIRKIIRKKLKPVLTDDGKIRILQMKTDELKLNIESTTEKLETTSETIENTSEKIENTSTEESVTKLESLITTNVAEESDLQTDQTTLPSSTVRFRPSYRPPKRPLNLPTTTEASNTPKVYSRRYNNGPYTTPILPSEREAGITERPRIEGLTRRPTFSVRPFGRRPFTTSRTTTIIDEPEYSDEDTQNEEIEEKEEKLVFVPLDKLFTRAPVLSSTVDEPALSDENRDEENSESEEYDNEGEEEQNDVITSTAKPVNRFALSQRTSAPSRIGLISGGRQSNRPLGFNRQAGVNQTNEEGSRRVNRPVAFQPNRSNRFGFSPTQSPSESTSKGYVRKYSANRPTSETAQTEIDIDAINAKHKQLFSNPKRFTTTTITSPSQETTTESEEFTTEMYQEITTDINETTVAETDSNDDIWLSMTESSANEEITTMDDLINTETTVTVTDVPINDQTTISEYITVQTDASTIKEAAEENIMTSTIKPHHVFSVNNSEKATSDEKSKDNTILEMSTDSPYVEMSTELNYENGSVKTSSHLDRLFAVSRIVEVSSKQDKHRLNSKNESRLIEVGEVIQEKKPVLDRIGEVSRFTLIKIVEGDIPKYLTNLSHEYPGEESPPFNPIRIDEARNARTLNIFSDNAKESLVASESVNAAYNHKNGFVEYIEPSAESENQDSKISDKNVFIVESTTIDESVTMSEASTPAPAPSTTAYPFVPGAVDLDEIRNSNALKKSNNPIESSTLALEGLFKSDDMLTGRQARIDLVPGPQPFVVYAAPQSSLVTSKSDSSDDALDSRTSSGRSITNFVKIQVLDSEKEKNISTPGKTGEFLGVPAAAEIILQKENAATKSPITITILNQTSVKDNGAQNESISIPEPITISIANLDKLALEKSDNVSSVPTTSAATTSVEPSPSTPQVQEAPTTPSITNTLNVTELLNETTTVFPILLNTTLSNTQSESDTDSTLSKIAKKRPKLPYIRRYQNNQIKSNNATRISVAPLASQNAKNRTKSSLESKNVPFTTPKYNRTNSYTSGKSRFSAIRTQNVPVDSRRQKPEINKFKPSSATDSPRTTPYGSDPNKVTIKPFRTNALRASLFARRTTTEAQDTIETTLQTVTDVPSSDNTIAPGAENFREENSKIESGARPSLFARRPANRLNSRLEHSRRGTTSATTEPSSTTQGSRLLALGGLRRRPAFERRTTTSPADGGNATEAAAPRARPTRLFVRKYQRSGAGNQTTPRTTSTTGSSGAVTTTRRSFRVGVRKRPLIASTTSTTTVLTPTLSTTPSADEEGTTIQYSQLETGGHDQETHSTVQQIQEKESSVESLLKKKVKIQKRPLFSTFKDNQNTPKEVQENVTKNEEVNQVGRKYSSVIKSDNTLVQREKDISELINAELSIDDIGDDVTASVAVAAHQLLSAPLPTIPSYALDDQSDTDEVPLTRAYLLASPSSPFVSPNNYVATTERYQGRTRLGFPNGRRISTTVAPQVIYTTSRTTPLIRRRKPSSPPAAFEKINPVKKIYRTVVDYEYYDDDDVRLVGKTPLQEKVLLRGSGVIQCLDQGNFPHPESCKKFISCAKMENGGVYGWAYTCPKGLSFDPVGGICNWSAGLGCRE